VRIAVLGAGAMGCIFGAAFTEAELDTVLVDVSGPLVERLNAQGVTVISDGEERQVAVRATSDPTSLGVVDLALLLVKSYHTKPAASLVRPSVGPETVVASLQNGWGNGDVLAEVFRPEQVVLGVTYNSGTVLDPGRVAHGQKRKGPCVVGPCAGDGLAGAERLAEVLRVAGFPATVTRDIGTAIWKKLVVTVAANAISALTGYASRPLGEDPDMLELMDSLAREAVAVARAAGFDLDEEERLAGTREAVIAAGQGRASMLQDLESGRRTEIDVINGAVVREADARGIDVPLNRAIVALVKGYERAHGLVEQKA
jgi:2-dehydropantoate 2-reductase